MSGESNPPDLNEIPEGKQVPALALYLLQHSNNQLNETMNDLVDSFRRSWEQEKATLQTVRENITRLCDQPWTPNPNDILRALYPSSDQVNKNIEKEEDQLLWLPRTRHQRSCVLSCGAQ